MRIVLAIILMMALMDVSMAAERKVVYPGKEWKKRGLAETKLDLKALSQINALMRKAKANGALIHKGYLVAEWNFGGSAARRFNIQSCTKSITSAVLGLTLADGLIPNLDAKVKKYYPDFDAGPYTDEITFRHLVTASSGIQSRVSRNLCIGKDYLKPGTVHRYNSDHFQYLSLALTYLHKTNLEEVAQKRILAPLQVQDGFAWPRHDGRGDIPSTVTLASGKSVSAVAGYAFSKWSGRDLARVGYLYLREGKWNGKRILPADYVKECRQPISIPMLEFKPHPPSDRDLSKLRYGLAWRGRVGDDGKTLWLMSGYGGQFCAVMPEHDLVMTKVNRWNRKPFTGIERFETLLWSVAQNASDMKTVSESGNTH